MAAGNEGRYANELFLHQGLFRNRYDGGPKEDRRTYVDSPRDDDQIVPIADSAMLSAKLVKNAELKIYKGAPHGMCTTEKDKVNQDLLIFIERKEAQRAA